MIVTAILAIGTCVLAWLADEMTYHAPETSEVLSLGALIFALAGLVGPGGPLLALLIHFILRKEREL